MEEKGSKRDRLKKSLKKLVPPLLFRIKGGVLRKIWLQVAVGILYSLLIVLFHYYAIEFEKRPIIFVTVLGLVIGLLLVFRTTTGYDRYWEGRKLWSQVTYRIRTMAASVWLGIKEAPESRVKDLIGKRSAINTLIAFAYATKNYLREEYSYDEDDDLKLLIPHLPRLTEHFNTPSELRRMSRLRSKQLEKSDFQQETSNNNDQSCKRHKSMSTRRREARHAHTNSVESIGGEGDDETRRSVRDSAFQAYDTSTPTNIPMEVIYYFLSYVYKVVDDKKIDAETGKILLHSANDLINCLTQLERILRSPIPMAYSMQLNQCIWLYLLFLPFQVVGSIGWYTIPGMALTCVFFLGIAAIGLEIENPFGYDDNDLPLDDYCDVLKDEVYRFVEHQFPAPESWILSNKNLVFLSQSEKSAAELAQMSFEDLQSHILSTKGKPEETQLNIPEGEQ